MSSAIPLACSLSGAELGRRADEVTTLFGQAVAIEELPDGFEFSFAASADRARELLEFVLTESTCCPFFTFELHFATPHSRIGLRVRGDEEVKEIARGAFVARESR
jgi:hypothetical protein